MSTEITPTPQETPGLLSKIVSLGSIERAVAFVLGPIVIAGSATLSGWLSTKIGIQVSSATITGAVATGGLAAGALVYKWLDGRQFPGLLKDEKLAKAGLSKLIPFSNDVKLIPGADGALVAAVDRGESLLPQAATLIQGSSLGHVPGIEETVQRLEQTIKSELAKAVELINKPASIPTNEKTKAAGATEASTSTAIQGNSGAQSAPAAAVEQQQPPPATPIPPASNDPAPATPVQGVAADAGAAPAQ
jgi:hypothetical protein